MTPPPKKKEKRSCDDQKKNVHNFIIPKKYSFLKTPQNTEIQMSEPQKWSQPKYTWKY